MEVLLWCSLVPSSFLLRSKLRVRGSNPNFRLQRATCYHYTNPQSIYNTSKVSFFQAYQGPTFGPNFLRSDLKKIDMLCIFGKTPNFTTIFSTPFWANTKYTILDTSLFLSTHNSRLYKCSKKFMWGKWICLKFWVKLCT